MSSRHEYGKGLWNGALGLAWAENGRGTAWHDMHGL
jgi:hypothetical protein